MYMYTTKCYKDDDIISRAYNDFDACQVSVFTLIINTYVSLASVYKYNVNLG